MISDVQRSNPEESNGQQRDDMNMDDGTVKAGWRAEEQHRLVRSAEVPLRPSENRQKDVGWANDGF